MVDKLWRKGNNFPLPSQYTNEPLSLSPGQHSLAAPLSIKNINNFQNWQMHCKHLLPWYVAVKGENKRNNEKGIPTATFVIPGKSMSVKLTTEKR